MPFIRVRAVDGPKHEFDAPVGEVDANPGLYEVLDKAVVDSPRDVVYIEPTKRAAPKRSHKKPQASPEISVGDTTKENE